VAKFGDYRPRVLEDYAAKKVRQKQLQHFIMAIGQLAGRWP